MKPWKVEAVHTIALEFHLPVHPVVAIVLALLGAMLAALGMWPAEFLAALGVALLRVVLIGGGAAVALLGLHGIWKALQ